MKLFQLEAILPQQGVTEFMYKSRWPTWTFGFLFERHRALNMTVCYDGSNDRASSLS